MMAKMIFSKIKNKCFLIVAGQKLSCEMCFTFHFFCLNSCSGTKWNVNVYLTIFQIFKCKAHVDKSCSNALDDCQANSNKKSNFREILSFFFLLKFYLKKDNLILIFEKVQIKNVNAVLCGKKSKCGHTGNRDWKQTFFILVA